MQCPNCKIELTRTDFRQPMPHAIYTCDECGYEAIWRLIRPHWSVIFDPCIDNKPVEWDYQETICDFFI